MFQERQILLTIQHHPIQKKQEVGKPARATNNIKCQLLFLYLIFATSLDMKINTKAEKEFTLPTFKPASMAFNPYGFWMLYELGGGVKCDRNFKNHCEKPLFLI